MKLSNKIIEEVVTEIAGEDVLPLVKKLKNKKNYSEFKLAEDLNQEVNTTRNQLYRLLNANLVSFIRRKDKKKGWYIYYWTFNLKMIKYIYLNLKKQKFERLSDRLKRESEEYFFRCDNKCMRLSFDQATDFEFKCPECGEILNQEDNTKLIKDLQAEVKSLKKDIKAA